jgi:hypothetical protein
LLLFESSLAGGQGAAVSSFYFLLYALWGHVGKLSVDFPVASFFLGPIIDVST